ncbi:MAG: sulfur carrier protein ThiS [Candidatus Margulisiibacteriota bacterium]
MISCTLNGVLTPIEDPGNLSGLLVRLGIRPTGVIIEHNGTLFKEPDFPQQQVQDGDVIEIIHFMGGG